MGCPKSHLTTGTALICFADTLPATSPQSTESRVFTIQFFHYLLILRVAVGTSDYNSKSYGAQEVRSCILVTNTTSQPSRRRFGKCLFRTKASQKRCTVAPSNRPFGWDELAYVDPGNDGDETVHVYGKLLEFEPNRIFSYLCFSCGVPEKYSD